MAIELDHIILAVNDRARSIRFYTEVMGLIHEGEDGPFSILRITPNLVLLISPSHTQGGQHLAFSMSRPEFEEAFARLKTVGIPYGGRFDSVGSMSEPGEETGARGMGKAVYFFDPDRHLIEIRHYDLE